MKRILFGVLGLAGVALVGFGIWLVSLPGPAAPKTQPAISASETEAMIAALKPPKRARPLVAIIGINDGTETTDYLLPYGVLRRAAVADVMLLATAPGPVSLYPVFTVLPDDTITAFDQAHPEGADYVIVPAMMRDDDTVALDWIRKQSDKGAIIVGICAGGLVVANTGLLDGKRATTHWYSVGDLQRNHPAIRYVADRRIVADKGVVTTTGVTASMPLTLTLIEAIAGRAKAEAVANELGMAEWDARHDSAAFKFTQPFALTAMGNLLPFWRHEQFGLALAPGQDEVSLALAADAWSRTYRSGALTLADAAAPVETRHGVRIVPDEVSGAWPLDRMIAFNDRLKPQQALDSALTAIEMRYGESTRAFVAMQLEYPAPR